MQIERKKSEQEKVLGCLEKAHKVSLSLFGNDKQKHVLDQAAGLSRKGTVVYAGHHY